MSQTPADARELTCAVPRAILRRDPLDLFHSLEVRHAGEYYTKIVLSVSLELVGNPVACRVDTPRQRCQQPRFHKPFNFTWSRSHPPVVTTMIYDAQGRVTMILESPVEEQSCQTYAYDCDPSVVLPLRWDTFRETGQRGLSD
jgi:hypothetical protein